MHLTSSKQVEEEGAGGQGADVDIKDLDLFFDDLEEDE